ncbi:MAG: GNAT family N-acetyltransferase [Amnibacterium sp.]
MSHAEGTIRMVEAHEWPIVAWLWQAFREDLSPVVHGLPYADGRFGAGPLEPFPSADGAGYLVRRPHPNTGEEAPIAFALVDGLTGERRGIPGFWVAPAARGDGVGRRLAEHVLTRHAGPWRIGFQHENPSAAAFWRRVADEAFGPGAWTETTRPVPHRPLAPPDHFIETVDTLHP